MPIIDCHVYLEGNVLPGVNQDASQLTASAGKPGD